MTKFFFKSNKSFVYDRPFYLNKEKRKKREKKRKKKKRRKKKD